MKIIQNTLIVLALGAVSANANFTLSPGAADTVAIGSVAQHVSYYTLTLGSSTDLKLGYTAAGLNLNNNVGLGGITSAAAFDPADSSLAVSGLTSSSFTTVAAGTYSLAVKWTLDSSIGLGTYDGTTSPYGILFGLKDSSPGALTTTLYDTVHVVPVPEPAQAIASVALLGCGGLIFIGRRFVSKKA